MKTYQNICLNWNKISIKSATTETYQNISNRNYNIQVNSHKYCRQVSTKCPGRRLHHLFSVIVVTPPKKNNHWKLNSSMSPKATMFDHKRLRIYIYMYTYRFHFLNLSAVIVKYRHGKMSAYVKLLYIRQTTQSWLLPCRTLFFLLHLCGKCCKHLVLLPLVRAFWESPVGKQWN